MEKVKIDTEYIRLDQLLKWSGIVGSGADAKYLITEGLVKVNNEVILQRGKKIIPGDRIEVELDQPVQFMVE